MFSGSYDPQDVTFLLKPVRLEPTPIPEKERLIQSGRRHYSEMISAESLPSPLYLHIFHQALQRQKTRFARHLFALASLIARRPGPIALVSLARAGTPIGVLLTRILRQMFGRSVAHYSVSIIRDRGIDETALRYVLARHGTEAIVFVDGWTGKGAIAQELSKSVRAFNERQRERVDTGLYAVADLCGLAAGAATVEDYLLPSSVLGCTISGLVSRSILNDAVIGPGDFHGCIWYQQFQPHDLSRWFVDTIMNELVGQGPEETGPASITADERLEWRRRSRAFLDDMQKRYTIRDVNHVKPGIGEATRVLLRRLPDQLLLRHLDHPDVEHLLLLAEEKQVAVTIDPSLPYLAAALIREVVR